MHAVCALKSPCRRIQSSACSCYARAEFKETAALARPLPHSKQRLLLLRPCRIQSNTCSWYASDQTPCVRVRAPAVHEEVIPPPLHALKCTQV
eukprot:363346-Chlamydomonas_euryale.AAC.5